MSAVAIEDRKVLALNQNWTAIGVISMKKAMKKLNKFYRDGTPVAHIIEAQLVDAEAFTHQFIDWTWADWSQLRPAEGEQGMRSVNNVYRIPEVIQYTKYNKTPNTKVTYNRRTIYKRDNNTCQYCGCKKPMSELSLDHVTPKCQGGLTTWDNIVVACVECNAKKAGRTPKEAKMKLLSVPKKPNYNFFPGDIKVKSWEAFLGAAYWLTELEHDGD